MGVRGAAGVITVLVDEAASPGARVPLPDSELHHMRVRRAGERERVRWTDGAGHQGEGDVERDGRGWLAIVSTEQVPAPVPFLLAVGAGDRDRFGWLAEKVTELGVTDLLPLETERSQSVGGRMRPDHVERLARRAREAVKQCGGAWATRVHPLVPLSDLEARAVGRRLLADAAGASGALFAPDEPLTIAVGPEGGLTATERDALLAAGFVPLALGPRILRFETAALVAAAAVAVARMGG